MNEKLIIWSKNLAIGLKDIDNQHKNFIGLINNAYLAHLKKDKTLMEENLNELMEFARIHFTTEENYFKKWNYPYAKEHMAEHEKIIIQILKFKDSFDIGKCDCEKFLIFLKDWLENHLKNHDFKYKDYFKEKGFI